MPEPAVGETLHRLLHAYKRALRDSHAEADIGLTVSHIRVLKGVARTDDITARHIAARMRQDKGRIARLIKDLESAGLVERHPHPEDGRRLRLVPTAAGRALDARVAAIEAEAGARMARGLTEADVRQFIDLADAMTANLERPEDIP